MPELIRLTDAECRWLLAANVVGRVGFDAGAGPRIHPVNYAMDGDAVVLRTAEGSELAGLADRGAAPAGPLVAFEVDHVDYDRHQGWSVLAVGRVSRVVDAADLERIAREWSPRPWAGGEREVVLRVAVLELTGRRLGNDWPPTTGSPVNRTL
ncbi:pyridoxamine 5'-phosphate oxidase family protein [Nocardioides panacis]|uniref:Pyridoxamine 5'-phosphate oxidase family protein n=1 Tax=Nocardioides panacis TaxID=2849501 RepID=A0A975SZK4_9ACTN|nr:pyridoxamine 5'-phosphate oxidase family protein [Nocardioides panacis]QWZ08864.1 pyridoxamine 5'-phosphate oxidase family protein [Nocardioides panacis]